MTESLKSDNNLLPSEEEQSQGEEAEKVEESLRDFIGKIITYYEKFNISNSLLLKYEKKISKAETLLEVFDVMKEMFEELMGFIVKNALTQKRRTRLQRNKRFGRKTTGNRTHFA